MRWLQRTECECDCGLIHTLAGASSTTSVADGSASWLAASLASGLSAFSLFSGLASVFWFCSSTAAFGTSLLAVCTTQQYQTDWFRDTVKPLMFACPLFRKFREPNKTEKLKGANINCRPKIGGNCYSISNYMVLIRQNKTGQNNFACKVANFWGSQIKGFYSIALAAVPTRNHISLVISAVFSGFAAPLQDLSCDPGCWLRIFGERHGSDF